MVAGVYGRQEPMSFSSDLDKRDLLITFGLDRRVQMKDSFFHNANSMIRREIYRKNSLRRQDQQYRRPVVGGESSQGRLYDRL